MKVSRSYCYTSYGPIPQNEYTIDNPNRNTDTAGLLQYEPTPEEVAYKLRLKNRQAMHPAGRRKTRGWARSWKPNGWRAESALLQDENVHMGRLKGYVRKSSV